MPSLGRCMVVQEGDNGSIQNLRGTKPIACFPERRRLPLKSLTCGVRAAGRCAATCEDGTVHASQQTIASKWSGSAGDGVKTSRLHLCVAISERSVARASETLAKPKSNCHHQIDDA
eukprot:6184413-Pleurochrysis_carterae.AAC.3